jgi:3-methylcrotonyl-CoA carboxylase alpha subunit
MRWVVRGAGGSREVKVDANGGCFEVAVDGRHRAVELVRFDGAVASLRFPENGRSFQVTYQANGNGSWRVAVGEREFELSVLTPVQAVEAVAAAQAGGPSQLKAPIPGKVVSVKVAPGDEVVPGQALIVLEAMKMENELASEQAGRVVAVHVDAGATVESGQLLVEME